MRSVLFLVVFFTHGLSALCLSTWALGQQVFSIKGTVSEKFSQKELLLYKYNSSFDQKLISKIDAKSGTFIYERELIEPDTYLLENTVDNTFFLFIWDADLTIDLTGPRFYEPAITGSLLTAKLDQFNKVNQDKYFHPIRKLDTLINQTSDKLILDSLQQVRRELIDWSRTASEAYRLTYCHNQFDSFVSLYLLTTTGDEFPITAEYRAAFDALSDRLKKHSRSRYFLKR